MWARKQLGPCDSSSLIRDARDFALQRGLVLRNGDNDNCVRQIPITLFPSPFPKRLYYDCLDIQPIVNKLMLGIANDSGFIENSLSDIIAVDDFTRNLLNVNRTILREGRSQPLISCINRSDYMLDKYMCPTNDRNLLRVRQVEVNAIASSLSAHSYNTELMHDYLMKKYRLKPNTQSGAFFPKNGALEMVAQGLIDAYDAYDKQDTFILLVSEEKSYNFSDFVQIELTVHKNRPDIRIVRRRFIDLPEIVQLGPNKELLVDQDNKEVALVYFRYGYDPSNYNFSEAWNMRLILERSRAIKCPSINFHLSGVKKFQQLLNNHEQLERFLDADEAKQLSDVFCKFWSLESGTQEGKDGYDKGINAPENLVLKPQREGGGHNIYGKDIKSYLTKLTRPENRSQYILMEYINSPQEKNWLLLHDDRPKDDLTRLDTSDKLISELGIFGSILADGSAIRTNDVSGYLVRSKRCGINEGGVVSGYAGLSSLVLIDDLEKGFEFQGYFDV